MVDPNLADCNEHEIHINRKMVTVHVHNKDSPPRYGTLAVSKGI